jgi:hypothetical protein
MMKKTKRYEDGGYLLDSEGKRVKSGSGEDIQTGSYDKEADMESARKKLASEVQDMVKAKSDSDRVSKDAEESSKAPASSAKMPTRPGQGAAKSKSGVVTKEELAKSGLTLRDYMNKQRGLTRRDGKAPERKTAPAVSSSYRSEGANKAKPAAPSGNVASTAPAKKSGSSLSALPMNPSLLRQRDEAEKRRDAARAARRAADEAEEKARPAKEAAQRKMLSEQPGAVAYRKKREEEDKMSPGQRSAARGKAVKEFFGMAKGGAVRGAGIAKQGVRKCKMV